jgi:hypothetical protein
MREVVSGILLCILASGSALAAKPSLAIDRVAKKIVQRLPSTLTVSGTNRHADVLVSKKDGTLVLAVRDFTKMYEVHKIVVGDESPSRVTGDAHAFQVLKFQDTVSHKGEPIAVETRWNELGYAR